MMDSTALLFLGISSCFPEAGGDTASFCLGNELLVDTGWYANRQLRAQGILPSSIHHICITHAHHDHILGLPALLYEHYRANTIDTLAVFGPKESVSGVVRNALRFIEKDFYWPKAGEPLVRSLEPEDCFETPNFEVAVCPSDHAVPGRCYKVKDKRNGIRVGFGGDGSYQSILGDFFKGCDVLVHEFSFGLRTPEENLSKHSSIRDAALCAEQAGAGILCPVHGPACQPESREAYTQEAMKLFHGRIHWPEPGELLTLTAGRNYNAP